MIGLPREPDDDEPRKPQGDTLQFMQGMWRLIHALEVRSKRMAKSLGVTGPQRLVIRMLGQTPDLAARDISAMLGMHPSTLTGILARLESQGLIRREVDGTDRRKQRFALTAGGKRIDRERKGTVEAAVRRALSRAADLPEVGVSAGTTALLEILVEELARTD